ncbi:MAG: Hint domain-containing protein [Pseudomonadota bacterium]
MFFKSRRKAGKRPDPLVLTVAPAPGLFAGTMIATPDCVKPVEDLCLGDAVLTLENGAQEITGLEKAALSVASHAAAAEHWPLLIPQGVLQNNASLTVAPSMRLVLEDRVAGRLFGHNQVSLRAVNLVGYRGIARAQVARHMAHVTLQFDAPQIITAQGGVRFDLADAAQVHNVMPLSDRQARQFMRELTTGGRIARPNNRPGLAWI